jgi:hypothetical protein
MIPGQEQLPQVRSGFGVAVSSAGHIAYQHSRTDGEASITIVDTLGAVVTTGRIGTGRGEVGAMTALYFGNEEHDLVALDVPNERFVTYGVDGSHKRTSESFAAGLPLGMHADSIDMILFSEDVMEFESVDRISVRTLGRRTIIHQAQLDAARVHRQPAASNASTIVFGAGVSYVLRSYDSEGTPMAVFGRDLPPRFMSEEQVDRVFGKRGDDGVLLPYRPGQREEYLAAPQPLFHNVALDESGRLWALGTDAEGQKYADIFADTAFVGRMNMPCETVTNYAAFNGDFMALVCESASRPDAMEVQLYRVIR